MEMKFLSDQKSLHKKFEAWNQANGKWKKKGKVEYCVHQFSFKELQMVPFLRLSTCRHLYLFAAIFFTPLDPFPHLLKKKCRMSQSRRHCCFMLYSHSGRGWGYTQDAAMVPLRNTILAISISLQKKKGTAASLFTFVTR